MFIAGHNGTWYTSGYDFNPEFTYILANIISAAIDPVSNKVVFNGSMIADGDNTTTYYVAATTDVSMTRDDMKTAINNGTASKLAYKTVEVSAGRGGGHLRLVLDYVMDVNKKVVPITAVHYMQVFLYVSDGIDLSKDDVDSIVIDNTNVATVPESAMLVFLNRVSKIVRGELTFNGTAFSMNSDITALYTYAPLRQGGHEQPPGRGGDQLRHRQRAAPDGGLQGPHGGRVRV